MIMHKLVVSVSYKV